MLYLIKHESLDSLLAVAIATLRTIPEIELCELQGKYFLENYNTAEPENAGPLEAKHAIFQMLAWHFQEAADQVRGEAFTDYPSLSGEILQAAINRSLMTPVVAPPSEDIRF